VIDSVPWVSRAALLGTALAFSLAACSDLDRSPVEPPSGSVGGTDASLPSPEGLDRISVGAAANEGVVLARCETTYRPPTHSGARRAGKVSLRIPVSAYQAAGRRWTTLRYYRYDLRGELSHTAACVLPSSDEAVEVALQRFSLRSALKDGKAEQIGSSLPPVPAPSAPRERPVPRERVLLQEECGTESNPCDDYDPIYNHCAVYPDDPDCQEDEEDEPGEPEPPPDDPPPCDPQFDDCGGGSDPGDGDDEDCDPAEELCDLCGDERDDIIAEYELFPVALSPTCEDFTQTASSVYFSHAELSVTNPYAWSIIRNALIAPASAGYGADRWRQLYGGPRIVESGYRPPAHNDAVDGTSQSRHMFGDALDLRVESRTQAEAEAMVDAAEDANAGFFYIGISSIDGNPGWVHADWRNH
jgi:hypothetical protein